MHLTLASGQALTGHYTSRVGLHFLHRTGRDLPLVGEVTGPYGPGDVLAVEIVRTCAQVLADAYERRARDAEDHVYNHSDVTDALERAGIDPDRLRSWLAGPFL